MDAIKLLLVTTLALALAGDDGPKASKPGSLEGSRWRIVDQVGEFEVEFQAAGKLRNRNLSDTTADDDAWEQDGPKVRLSFNGKYAEYEGTLEGDEILSGRARNVAGSTWAWKATRVHKDDPAEKVLALLGTRWRYTDSMNDEHVLTFTAGGKLVSDIAADMTPDNDEWSQEDRTVRFSFNDRYAEYEGRITGKDSMSGTARNKAMLSWTWKATRISDAK
jgi:hypothetical protein